MIRCSISCAALALALAAPPLAAQQPHGCYALEFGAWSAPLTADSILQLPPRHITIESLFAPDRADGFGGFVRPAIPSERRSRATWSPSGQDSVRLLFTDGATGASLRVRVTEQALEGTIRLFGGARVPGRPVPLATVRGTRVPCDTTDHGARP